jgi:hypothetical protein
LIDGKPAAKDGHSRKSRDPESLSLKKVLSDLIEGMRKMRRSITGSSLASENDRIIDQATIYVRTISFQVQT